MEIQCPNCNGEIIIDEINCNVFRHAYFKKTG